MKISIINGPNINMLGIREPEIYGTGTYEELVDIIHKHASILNVETDIFQSNHEGDIIDRIQDAYFNKTDGIIINAGGLTHTSISILDALRAAGIPTVEVHISCLEKREEYRQHSYISEYASKVISGKGLNGYLEAMDYLVNK